jgi:hypothetical protein
MEDLPQSVERECRTAAHPATSTAEAGLEMKRTQSEVSGKKEPLLEAETAPCLYLNAGWRP